MSGAPGQARPGCGLGRPHFRFLAQERTWHLPIWSDTAPGYAWGCEAMPCDAVAMPCSDLAGLWRSQATPGTSPTKILRRKCLQGRGVCVVSSWPCATHRRNETVGTGRGCEKRVTHTHSADLWRRVDGVLPSPKLCMGMEAPGSSCGPLRGGFERSNFERTKNTHDHHISAVGVVR